MVSDLMVPGFPLPSCVSHQFFTMGTYGALRARNFLWNFHHTLSVPHTKPTFFFPSLLPFSSSKLYLCTKRNHACCSSYSYLHGGFRLCLWYVDMHSTDLIDICQVALTEGICLKQGNQRLTRLCVP